MSPTRRVGINAERGVYARNLNRWRLTDETTVSRSPLASLDSPRQAAVTGLWLSSTAR